MSENSTLRKNKFTFGEPEDETFSARSASSPSSSADTSLLSDENEWSDSIESFNLDESYIENDDLEMLPGLRGAPMLKITNLTCKARIPTKMNISYLEKKLKGAYLYLPESPQMLKGFLKPGVRFRIFASGKFKIFGTNTVEKAFKACYDLAKRIKKMGEKVALSDFSIISVEAVCDVGFEINLEEIMKDFTNDYIQDGNPLIDIKCRCFDSGTQCIISRSGSLKIFEAPSIFLAKTTLARLYPLLCRYRETVSKNDMCDSTL